MYCSGVWLCPTRWWECLQTPRSIAYHCINPLGLRCLKFSYCNPRPRSSLLPSRPSELCGPNAQQFLLFKSGQCLQLMATPWMKQKTPGRVIQSGTLLTKSARTASPRSVLNGAGSPTPMPPGTPGGTSSQCEFERLGARLMSHPMILLLAWILSAG